MFPANEWHWTASDKAAKSQYKHTHKLKYSKITAIALENHKCFPKSILKCIAFNTHVPVRRLEMTLTPMSAQKRLSYAVTQLHLQGFAQAIDVVVVCVMSPVKRMSLHVRRILWILFVKVHKLVGIAMYAHFTLMLSCAHYS